MIKPNKQLLPESRLFRSAPVKHSPPPPRELQESQQARTKEAQARGQSMNAQWKDQALGPWDAHRKPRLPANWRDRLPDPASYYREYIEKLGAPNSKGWAQGLCPFHEDNHESLSVHLSGARGGWRCFAGCGSGDLLAFHMRRTGLAFAEAVRELLGGVA